MHEYPPPPLFYPLTPNRISECVPGELYDVRGYFEEEGAKFGATGFAWYNPDSSILVARASPADMDFIYLLLMGCYVQPIKLRLKGEVFVKAADGGEPPPTHRLRWDTYARSGQTTKLSSSGGPLGYSCEMEPLLSPESGLVDYTMLAKVTYDGREYSATSQATIALSRPHSILLGTTPAGDEVRLEMTLAIEETRPASPLDDSAARKRITECIERTLHLQIHHTD